MSGTASPPHHEQINLDTMEEQDFSQFNNEVDDPDALRRAPSPFSPLVDYDEEFEADEIREGVKWSQTYVYINVIVALLILVS